MRRVRSSRAIPISEHRLLTQSCRPDRTTVATVSRWQETDAMQRNRKEVQNAMGTMQYCKLTVAMRWRGAFPRRSWNGQYARDRQGLGAAYCPESGTLPRSNVPRVTLHAGPPGSPNIKSLRDAIIRAPSPLESFARVREESITHHAHTEASCQAGAIPGPEVDCGAGRGRSLVRA
jgi:hypothetical protein